MVTPRRQALGRLTPPGASAGPPSRQRARLLAAVTEIVCESGASSLSAAQIAGRAGVSVGAFNRLFRDPRDCLLAAFEHAVTLAGERALAASQTQSSWIERVRAALAALLRFADEQPELARLCVLHAPSAGPPLLGRCRELSYALAQLIDEGAPARDDSARPWSKHTVVGAVLGTIQARLREPGPVELSPLLSSLTATIVLPYLGPDAAQAELARERPIPPHPQGEVRPCQAPALPPGAGPPALRRR